MVSFGAQNLPTDSFDLGQEPMTQMRFGVSQQIPYPGKLALREAAAEHEAEAATDSFEETRLRLISDVKTTWWRLFYLDRALEIIEINKDLLRQFVTITETKYKVGQGLQQDVLLAQLELSKLLDQGVQLNGLRRNETSRINALLDRPAETQVRLPSQETVAATLPTLRPVSDLLERAGETRPLIAQRQHFVDAARTRRDLAKKDLLPDFNVGAFYGIRDDDNIGRSRADFLTFQLSMNIPLFAGRKQKMAISQRNSELMERQYALQDEWATIRDQIMRAVSDFQKAREQFSLFETGIVPQARQTVASILAGYQVNKVDFLNLVRAQITLYNYETRYWQALTDANSALARLVAAVGEENVHE
jgi:outer membrane protein TolC